MPEKQGSSHDWKNPKTIIAAISAVGLLTLWNTFATHDRRMTETWSMFIPTLTITPESEFGPVCSPHAAQVRNPGKRCVTVASTRSS